MNNIYSYANSLNTIALKSKETIVEVFKIIYSLDKLEKNVEETDSLAGIDCRSVYVDFYENWSFTVKKHEKINYIFNELITDESYEITTDDFYNVNLIIKVDLLLFLEHVVSVVCLYESLHTCVKDTDFNIIEDINSSLGKNFESVYDIRKLINNLLTVYMGKDYVKIIN